MKTITMITALLIAFQTNADDRMDYYGLARSQAIKEKRGLRIYVQAKGTEGVIETPNSDAVCVILNSFQDCDDGDIIFAEYRSTEGGWLEWVKTFDAKEGVKFQAKPNMKKKSVSLATDDCPTGT